MNPPVASDVVEAETIQAPPHDVAAPPNGSGLTRRARVGSGAATRRSESGGISTSAKLGGGAIAAGLIVLAAVYAFSSGDESTTLITATATIADLPITVTERGELESSKKVDLRCEVEGRQIKIVEIMEEGTQVEKGDVLIRFDTEELSRKHAEQEIKFKQAEAKADVANSELEVAKNTAAAEVSKAETALALAKLEHKKYLDGEYGVEVDDLQGLIALAERDLQKARDDLAYNRRLVKKGYGKIDTLLQQEISIKNLEFFLKRDEKKLHVLTEYTREYKDVELGGKVTDAERELERAENSGEANITKAQTDLDSAIITAGLEKTQLEKLQKQLDLCVITAPQPGVLVYSKDRWWDESSRVGPGALVYSRQTLVSLPDLSQMQVKVNVHESVVKKVKPGQKAEIRIEAFSNQVLTGTVETVATLADSNNSWRRGGVKEYKTVVKVDEVSADGGIKPGMSAEVKITADILKDRLVLPVSAVTANQDEHFVYVVEDGEVTKTRVKVGANNNTHVEITDGLSEGAKVTLDARVRMDAELKESDGEDESAEDESAEDESAEDESAEDESAEDESAEDESAEDESAEDESAEDESAGDESAGETSSSAPPQSAPQ